MRNSTSWKLPAAVAVFLLGSVVVRPVSGQTVYSGDSAASSVKVNGTSTLHAWEMEGKVIGGTITFGPDVKLDPAQAAISGVTDGKIQVKVHAVIPVTLIYSKAEHKPEVMDGLMKEALKADNFPRIEYNLTEMTVKGTHEANKPFEFDTTGNLEIAGVTNKVSFPITIDASDPAKLKVSGTVPVKMTAYGVEPPAPNIGLGLMKCGDDVTITIDWGLKKRP